MRGPQLVFAGLALILLFLFGRGGTGRPVPRTTPLTSQPRPITSTRPTVPAPPVRDPTARPQLISGALIDIDITGGRTTGATARPTRIGGDPTPPASTRPSAASPTPFVLFPGAAPINGNGRSSTRTARSGQGITAARTPGDRVTVRGSQGQPLGSRSVEAARVARAVQTGGRTLTLAGRSELERQLLFPLQ